VIAVGACWGGRGVNSRRRGCSFCAVLEHRRRRGGKGEVTRDEGNRAGRVGRCAVARQRQSTVVTAGGFTLFRPLPVVTRCRYPFPSVLPVHPPVTLSHTRTLVSSVSFSRLFRSLAIGPNSFIVRATTPAPTLLLERNKTNSSQLPPQSPPSRSSPPPRCPSSSQTSLVRS